MWPDNVKIFMTRLGVEDFFRLMQEQNTKAFSIISVYSHKCQGSTQTADSSKRCMKFHSSHMPRYSSWALVVKHECKQKTNSVTTEAMIKFIREMSPSNASQFEVKKYMEMPYSCMCFALYALLYRSNSSDCLHVVSS